METLSERPGYVILRCVRCGKPFYMAEGLAARTAGALTYCRYSCYVGEDGADGR